MKSCTTMQDVRQEIDRLDKQLVPLLLERLAYVAQAGTIKESRDTVIDEWRIEDVVKKVKFNVTSGHSESEYIEKLYRYLITLSIEHEFKIWDQHNKNLEKRL
ncbi:chorismate mutase [Kordiimonas pumila]|uniref:chorismate mutase n=1 Tax=Kordiimonas pumila TaxID=2161677 RepID=A0ABV7D1K8_9PROT|nr:chorismate mutase [Kordiimonas pumila]